MNKFKIEIKTEEHKTYIEYVEAEDELGALDIAYEKYKNRKILDIKVVR